MRASVSGLCVQRVEDRLDQQQIGAALDQRNDGLAIGLAQFIERDRAIAGIGHVGRDGRGAIGGAKRASHKAAPAVFSLRHVASLPRKPCAVAIERVDIRFAAVIGLRNRGGGERVGFANIGAGQKIRQMNVANGLGLRQDQNVVVALLVVAVILENLSAKIGFVEL